MHLYILAYLNAYDPAALGPHHWSHIPIIQYKYIYRYSIVSILLVYSIHARIIHSHKRKVAYPSGAYAAAVANDTYTSTSASRSQEASTKGRYDIAVSMADAITVCCWAWYSSSTCI